MSYRNILVHVDDAAASASRLDYAVRFAQAHDATLSGIYLVPGTEMTPSAAVMLRAEVVARRLAEFDEAQHAAERAFRAATAAAGLRAAEWRAPAGAPVEAAIAHGRCADLFILGQRNPSGSGFGEALVSNVLLSSGRPILVVPHVGAPAGVGDNVLVGWDGGREAARAIGDALPLLARARNVAIIARDDGAESDVDDRLADTRLRTWLRSHDIAADVARHEAVDIGTGEWLLSSAADLQSDLLVLGGYGHARTRELVLGGVTRTVLRSMTVPVFMAH
jgi:nucleotide-binding universal stress UspA family protein